jgi:hypothetical protein
MALSAADGLCSSASAILAEPTTSSQIPVVTPAAPSAYVEFSTASVVRFLRMISAADLPLQSRGFTAVVSVYFPVDPVASGQMCFFHFRGGSTDILFETDNSGNLHAQLCSSLGSSACEDLHGRSVLGPGQWYVVALRYAHNEAFEIWLDGHLDSHASSATAAYIGADVTYTEGFLGACLDNAGAAATPLVGYMRQASIHARALTLSDLSFVTDLYGQDTATCERVASGEPPIVAIFLSCSASSALLCLRRSVLPASAYITPAISPAAALIHLKVQHNRILVGYLLATRTFMPLAHL